MPPRVWLCRRRENRSSALTKALATAYNVLGTPIRGDTVYICICRSGSEVPGKLWQPKSQLTQISGARKAATRAAACWRQGVIPITASPIPLVSKATAPNPREHCPHPLGAASLTI